MMNKKHHERIGFTLIELLVVMAIIGILVGLLLPAVQSVRTSAARLECGNRVRQIGIAALAHEAARRHFPSGINAPDHPHRPSLGWLAQILPFAEQDSLYKQSNAEFALGTHPVGGPHATLQTYVDVFMCPSDPRSGEAQFTHEFRLVGISVL